LRRGVKIFFFSTVQSLCQLAFGPVVNRGFRPVDSAPGQEPATPEKAAPQARNGQGRKARKKAGGSGKRAKGEASSARSSVKRTRREES
jgi:hypothetical protein